MDRRKVLVIGGGPAGLAFAARLVKRGVRDVLVLEREKEAGGVPRHCGHWGFGWESHRSLCTGPQFAARLREEAKVLDVRTRHAVLKLLDRGTVLAHSPDRGPFELSADTIVLACGAREASRAARLIGGVRTPDVMSTSTLQQLVYLKGARPFARPVILGGEWLSFSALMTCRHAGIKPAAMLVEGPRLDAPFFFAWGARAWYGVPVLRTTELLSIEGGETVTSVRVRQGRSERSIACDGVIVSGRLVPEDGLLAGSGAHAGGDDILIAGNMQGAIKTAGRCVAEAQRQAELLAERLA
jgi:NADPH-dependent 2,4-dienoyl-CoA reductase/sulfur reductase-like enzyme